jgi:hypothetical protein
MTPSFGLRAEFAWHYCLAEILRALVLLTIVAHGGRVHKVVVVRPKFIQTLPDPQFLFDFHL